MPLPGETPIYGTYARPEQSEFGDGEFGYDYGSYTTGSFSSPDEYGDRDWIGNKYVTNPGGTTTTPTGGTTPPITNSPVSNTPPVTLKPGGTTTTPTGGTTTTPTGGTTTTPTGGTTTTPLSSGNGMAETDRNISESIVREAPDIEAFKIGLLESSRNLANIPLQGQIPQQDVAGLSNLEKGAIASAGTQGGIGGYRSLARSGRQTLGTGLGVLNQGVGALGSAEQQLGFAGGRFQAGPGYDAQRFSGGPNYTAQQFGGGPSYTAQGFDPSTISKFNNPFEDQAVQQALADIRREGNVATTQQDAAAVQAGAFGGSRQGIQRTELARNVFQEQGRTAAGMRQAGFQNAALQAQQAFEQQQRRAQAESQFGAQTQQQAFEDFQRRQQSQAQFGTQTALQAFEEQQRRAQAESQFGTQTRQQAFEAEKNRRLQRAQQYQGIAGQYGNLGQAGSNIGMQQLQAAEQAQNQGMKEIGTSQTLGALQRGQQQARLNSQYNLARQRLYEPYSRLSWLSDQYKGAPSTQSSLGSVTSPAAASPSAFQQIASAGTGILGAAAASRSLFG